LLAHKNGGGAGGCGGGGSGEGDCRSRRRRCSDRCQWQLLMLTAAKPSFFFGKDLSCRRRRVEAKERNAFLNFLPIENFLEKLILFV